MSEIDINVSLGLVAVAAVLWIGWMQLPHRREWVAIATIAFAGLLLAGAVAFAAKSFGYDFFQAFIVSLLLQVGFASLATRQPQRLWAVVSARRLRVPWELREAQYELLGDQPESDNQPEESEPARYQARLPDQADAISDGSGTALGLVGSATLMWDANEKSLTVAESMGAKSVSVEFDFLQGDGPRNVVASFEPDTGPFDVYVSCISLMIGDYGMIIENTRSKVRCSLNMPSVLLLESLGPQKIELFFYRREYGP